MGLAVAMVVVVTATPARAQEPAPTEPAPPSTGPPPDPTPADPAPEPTVPPPPPDVSGGGGGVVPDGEAPPPPEPDPGAEPPPPPEPVADPAPRVRVLLARLAVLDADRAVDGARAGLDAARADQAGAEDRVAAAAQAAADAGGGVDGARRLMEEMAVVAFIRGAGGVSSATAQVGVYERRQHHALFRTVLANRNAGLEGARHGLERAEADLRAAEGVAAQSAAVVAGHEEAVAAAAEVAAQARAELGRAQAADVERTFDRAHPGPWQLAIMGDSAFTADELAAWAAPRALASRASVPVPELAALYVEEGRVEGVRGDMAFAQAVLETGWFTNDDTARFNNFAGVGHCDTCPSGFAFGSARLGVRGQLQLLEGYVHVEPEYANPLVDRRLRGPAGCCATWAELSGVWATSTNYGAAILGVYLEMLTWLVEHRTAAPPG